MNMALAAFLWIGAQSSVAADVLTLTASSPEVHAVVERALRSDVKSLAQWSEKPKKSGIDPEKFCPPYDQRNLVALFKALADHKTNIAGAHAALAAPGEPAQYDASNLDQADQAYRHLVTSRGREISPETPGHTAYVLAQSAKAEALYNVYALMSFRPSPKETLRELLEYARAAAQAAGNDARARELLVRLDKVVATLVDPPPGRVRISQQVSQCYRLTTVPPVYPPAQRSAGVEDTAVLRVVIAQNGRVKEIEAKSGGQEFTDAAGQSVSQWTYRPYYVGGEPVEVETQVTINFRLR